MVRLNLSLVFVLAVVGCEAAPESVRIGPSGASTVAKPTKLGAQEDMLWSLIKDSTDARDFDDYLLQFPEGRYAVEARVLKRRAESGEGKAATSPGNSEPSTTSSARARTARMRARLNQHDMVSIGLSKLVCVGGWFGDDITQEVTVPKNS